jgi:hypothetical protein
MFSRGTLNSILPWSSITLSFCAFVDLAGEYSNGGFAKFSLFSLKLAKVAGASGGRLMITMCEIATAK